ncbi:hypothetical protein HF086_000853 [Spodoptera exigua]|uniref:THAP-type domain-containing protein n=1 Tax=Spodoptera exigua TaxID=7107 RepID=A0A922SEC7_SPOEX|nr:hypothetical protein HF086_000853 [Spodoptera exigua]
MVYKWCTVPECKNTSIKTPEKIFVSVPTNPKRRKNVVTISSKRPKERFIAYKFFYEDHFDMEQDTNNYLKYKMGFSQKILLRDEAVPTKFHCQEDRKRRLSPEAGPSREAFLKRQRRSLVTECLESQSTTETEVESIQQLDNIIQDAVMLEGARLCKYEYKIKKISTSPLKVCTTSSFTSPFKIEPCRLQPSQSGAVKAVKKKIVLEDDKSDSEISCLESGHSSPFVPTATSSSSKMTDSESNATETEDMEKLQCLKNTMRLIENKPTMYIGISKDCYF